MKTCFKCRQSKSLSDFYRHSAMADGHLNKCKSCTRKDAGNRRNEKLKDPAWVAAESNRQRRKARLANYEDPIVSTARRAIRKLGRSRDWHWHHWSYAKEHHLDVIKLTPPQHRQAHCNLVYDKTERKYRRADTMELLDSRDKHEGFLMEVFATPRVTVESVTT